MKTYLKILFLSLLVFTVIRCEKKESVKNNQETILKGKATLLVDETLKPIIEDQVEIFESRYKAKLKIEAKSEAEVIQALVNDSGGIAILSKKLSDEELKIFENKKIIPKITPFATDAIALILNKKNKDTIIALEEVVSFMQGKKSSKFKGIVFDNPNSSTVRYFLRLSGLKKLPETGVFSFKTNNEVIKYVAENEGMIGVVGINYIFEPMPSIQKDINKINVLYVKDNNEDEYYYPTQNNIAEGKYALTRELYIVNCQGFSGLGMGFASFIAGDVGQRIILKSGLVPLRVPPRKIIIRNKINNDKN